MGPIVRRRRICLWHDWVTNYASNSITRILKSDSSTTTIGVGTSPESLGDMTGYAYDNYTHIRHIKQGEMTKNLI